MEGLHYALQYNPAFAAKYYAEREREEVFSRQIETAKEVGPLTKEEVLERHPGYTVTREKRNFSGKHIMIFVVCKTWGAEPEVLYFSKEDDES